MDTEVGYSMVPRARNLALCKVGSKPTSDTVAYGLTLPNILSTEVVESVVT
jgi:hypothetical protein